MPRPILLSALALALLAAGPVAAPPSVGEQAHDFTLNTIDGQPVHLAALLKSGPVVFVQLRGWVGYQCPLCTKQVSDFMAHADDFAKLKTTIVFSYPGAAAGLKKHAEDFEAGKSLPANVRFVLDPGLKVVNEYGLRWEKKGETAYPATIAIGMAGKVRYAKVSHSHAGRAEAAEVLDTLHEAEKR